MVSTGLKIFACCALLLVARGARAEDSSGPAPGPEEPSYTEDDLFRFLEDELEVTTASQMKTKITEAPQAVYVLTREEIARLGAVNIADLLRHVPGLIVANPTHGQWTVGVEAPSTVSNGLVLVLVDGRAIYAPFSLSNEWLPVPISPDDLERVEVILGPSSTVHGSQAVFGVVNFITRDAGSEGVSARVAAGGSHGADLVPRFGDIVAHGAGTVHLGPLRLRAAGGYDRVTPSDTQPLYADGRVVAPTAAHRGFGNLRGEVDFSDDINMLLFAGGSGHDGPYYSYSPGIARGFDGYLDGQLSLRRLLSDDDQLNLRAYYRIKSWATEAPLDSLLPSIPIEMVEHAGLARVLYTTGLPFNNRLATAIEARWDDSEFELIDALGSYQYFSVFAQDEFRPIEPLIITGGVRLETQVREGIDFFHHLSVSPRLSAVWLPHPGHSLRLAYGQAVFYQGGFVEDGLVRVYNDSLLIFRGQPQPTDEPTHIWELGYRGQVLESLVVTLSYAFRLLLTRIWIAPGEESLLPLSFTRFYGDESRHTLDATASFRPSSLVRVDLALSWLIHSDRPEAYTERVSDAPAYRISARAHFSPHERVNFDVDGQLLAPRSARSTITGEESQLAGSLYLNARLAYRFMDAPRLQIFGRATNLTDTSIGDGVDAELADLGVSRIGRRFLLGLAGEF